VVYRGRPNDKPEHSHLPKFTLGYYEAPHGDKKVINAVNLIEIPNFTRNGWVPTFLKSGVLIGFTT